MYSFNERQLELKKRVREFVEQEVIPVSSELDRSSVFPSRLVVRCGELGFVDKELMQNGRYSASEVCVILEELARGSASLALALIPHYLACDIMQSAANPEMRRRELEPGFRLERLFAYAISEASGGSDVLGIDTTAIALDKEWILNGSKSWITSMGAADAYLIAARTSLNGRSRNVSLFCVDASAPGLILGESESMIGLNGSPIGTVRHILKGAGACDRLCRRHGKVRQEPVLVSGHILHACGDVRKACRLAEHGLLRRRALRLRRPPHGGGRCGGKADEYGVCLRGLPLRTADTRRLWAFPCLRGRPLLP